MRSGWIRRILGPIPSGGPTSDFFLLPSRLWSGKRDSNPRHQPWQGCALPTELFPQSTSEVIRGKVEVRAAAHKTLPRLLPSIVYRLTPFLSNIANDHLCRKGWSISAYEPAIRSFLLIPKLSRRWRNNAADGPFPCVNMTSNSMKLPRRSTSSRWMRAFSRTNSRRRLRTTARTGHAADSDDRSDLADRNG